jgi:hypothetical protein
VILGQVTPDQFLDRCKRICHVGPEGSWSRIATHGFRTAEQLIQKATLDDARRTELLTMPRAESVRLEVDGDEVVLRDQEPLFARKDLDAVLGDGLDIDSWVQLLNRRVYFYTDEVPMKKLLDKYVERDGAQEVIWLSPLRLLRAAGGRLELAAQNTGAVARRGGTQKTLDTFVPLARFPDRKPNEVTVVDGLDEIEAVVRVERFLADGTRIALPV